MCQMSPSCVREDNLRDLYNERQSLIEDKEKEELEKIEAPIRRQQYLDLLEEAKKSINW